MSSDPCSNTDRHHETAAGHAFQRNETNLLPSLFVIYKKQHKSQSHDALPPTPQPYHPHETAPHHSIPPVQDKHPSARSQRKLRVSQVPQHVMNVFNQRRSFVSAQSHKKSSVPGLHFVKYTSLFSNQNNESTSLSRSSSSAADYTRHDPSVCTCKSCRALKRDNMTSKPTPHHTPLCFACIRVEITSVDQTSKTTAHQIIHAPSVCIHGIHKSTSWSSS